MTTQADIRRRVRVWEIVRATGSWSRHPHPGQKYRHGWLPVGPLAAASDADLLKAINDNGWDSAEFKAAFHEAGSRPGLAERALRLLDDREARERREAEHVEEQYRRDLTRRLLADRGDTNAMKHLRLEYRAWVGQQMIDAEPETGGYYLNDRGEAAKIRPVAVWTSERDFERYASLELRDYKRAHPDAWKTFAAWREQYAPVLNPGRSRSRRNPDTPRNQALPGLTGRPAGRSIAS